MSREQTRQTDKIGYAVMVDRIATTNIKKNRKVNLCITKQTGTIDSSESFVSEQVRTTVCEIANMRWG